MQFRGNVSGFRPRTEQAGRGYVTIWDFRIERFDPQGRPLPRVPVEMRGTRFDGAINEGDLVEVDGEWREGQTLHTGHVKNLTTAADVHAHGGGGGPVGVLRSLVGLVLTLVFIAVFLIVAYVIATQALHFGSQ